MILVCHVISYDHVIQGWWDFLMESHTLAKFGSHRHRGSEDMVLVCHLISQDHVSK